MYIYDPFRSFNERGEIFGFSSCYANFRRKEGGWKSHSPSPLYVNTIVALMARPVIRKGGRAARDPLFNCIQLFSIAALNNFQLAKSPVFFSGN